MSATVEKLWQQYGSCDRIFLLVAHCKLLKFYGSCNITLLSKVTHIDQSSKRKRAADFCSYTTIIASFGLK
jgi:hypothetical protein